ncbi:MAG: AAA family ATPase [Candidatus Delongbacteria bacterium]|nr:AAA family ATPase [Candidatus Delongbacteria bacterium]
MKRKAYEDLVRWKNSKNRKPLLLQGARQVGKTYLVNEFAGKEYKDYFYFNFEQTPEIIPIFKQNLYPKAIIEKLSLFLGKKINSENTMIFFDEIQVSPEAITSLKYFCEESPEYHIIAAGSLLGVSI